MVDARILDRAPWASMAGRHAAFSEGGAQARRYLADICPFAAIEPGAGAEAWAELAGIVGPGEVVLLPGVASGPGSWSVVDDIPVVQLIATDRLISGPCAEAIELGPSDVPEMLDLVERTQPGPFLPRTYRLGRYIGVRRGGALIAMAGERMQPEGFTEISAVCTDPAFQRQGLGAALVRDIADGIRGRGDTPFLHAAATNVTAIRLYEAMGFARRRTVPFRFFRTPA